jgi:hypothetical protein
MDEYEFELREVPYEPLVAPGERLEESAGDVASIVGAAAGAGALAYARAHYNLAREDRAPERDQWEAEQQQLRRELELENRRLRAQLYGLDGLDAQDGLMGLTGEGDYFDSEGH